MGRALREAGLLFHDDTVADFGGNDGFAANEFYRFLAIKPLVVDCEPLRLRFAQEEYGLRTLETFLEDMTPLADKSIDWAFCSHTMEHTREPEKALREMARIVKRGAFFVLPIEDEDHVEHNHAHSIHVESMGGWKKLLTSNGWRVKWARRPIAQECHILAVPR